MRMSKDPLAWGAASSLVAVLAKYLVSGVTLTWGDKAFAAGPADSGAIAAILGPILAAYVASRHKSLSKAEASKPNES